MNGERNAQRVIYSFIGLLDELQTYICIPDETKRDTLLLKILEVKLALCMALDDTCQHIWSYTPDQTEPSSDAPCSKCGYWYGDWKGEK